MGGSHVLVSICDVSFDPRWSCLLRMDTNSYLTEAVDVGSSEPLVIGGMGLCADDVNIFHVSQLLRKPRSPGDPPIVEADMVTQLSVLDRDSLDVVDVQALPEIHDCHSIARLGDELYAVSTATDELVAYQLEGSKATNPRVIWTPSGGGEDAHHVNAVSVVEGEIVCSAFGPKDSYAWTSAAHGYLHNVNRDVNVLEGLKQPHTVLWNNGRLYYCNSRLGTVETDGAVVAYVSGYSRGLAFGPDDTMYVGTSVGRRPADDPIRTDTFGHPTHEGELNGRCAVVQITPSGRRTEVGLSFAGFEVYDLLVV